MSDEVVIALVAVLSSLLSGLLVAVVNHLFTWRKTEAEAEKMKAEAKKALGEYEKNLADSEKIRAETVKVLQDQAGKLGSVVERAETIIKSGVISDESEATNRLTREIILKIHSHLRKNNSERIEREVIVKIISPLLQDNQTLVEFTIDTICGKGYLTETSPHRYEISRMAKMKFFSGGLG